MKEFLRFVWVVEIFAEVVELILKRLNKGERNGEREEDSAE